LKLVEDFLLKRAHSHLRSLPYYTMNGSKNGCAWGA
jgi:hypothetical protein